MSDLIKDMQTIESKVEAQITELDRQRAGLVLLLEDIKAARYDLMNGPDAIKAIMEENQAVGV